MNSVVLRARCAQYLRAGLLMFPLGLFFSTIGCGRGHDAEAMKTAGNESPLEAAAGNAVQQAQEAADERSTVPVDEDDLWVPMTGSEKIIVDGISHLTEGAEVRAISGDDEATDHASSSRAAE